MTLTGPPMTPEPTPINPHLTAAQKVLIIVGTIGGALLIVIVLLAVRYCIVRQYAREDALEEVGVEMSHFRRAITTELIDSN